jgi:hypothetical protein
MRFGPVGDAFRPRRRRALKHTNLRNEPDWKSMIFMWNGRIARELGCEGGKIQSGSFGMELSGAKHDGKRSACPTNRRRHADRETWLYGPGSFG